MSQRIEIAELALREQTRKWDLFIGDVSISSKSAIMNFEEKEMFRKGIETLFMRVQELEGRYHL